MSVDQSFSDEDYPGLYQAADKESVKSQKSYYKCLSWYLILLIIGAFIALFSGDSKLYAFFAAICFLASLSLSILMAVMRYDRTWYSARAVAESVKTRAWRFIMCSEPYKNSAEESKRVFLSDLQAILDQNREVTSELCDESATRHAITNKMDQIRSLGFKDRLQFYKSSRVENQRD